MFKFFRPKNSLIEFRCLEEDWDVIPKPFPARKHMPSWYKSLESKLGSGFDKSTIKRCPPFLDAMVVGWIIPLAANVHIKSNEDCSGIEWDCKFNKPIIETHAPEQLSGDKHPQFPKPPLKFINHWSIKVPEGWSVLFVPPLNRPDERFTCITGLVDCDHYEEFINFPGFWNKPNFDGILPAGTPLIQAIPIKRDSFNIESDCHAFTSDEWKVIEKTRAKRRVNESLYRDEGWVRK